MVNNCDEFYFVVSGDTCASIASAHGITEERFAEWNTGVGGTACTGLWQKVYVCVSIVGHTPTPTDPGNGIETPMPTQPGMVDNCDEFYMVVSGDTCTAIASKHGITEEQFRTWNTGVGSDCSGIWLNTYTCVSIIGHTPTPTDPGNGIETPMPTQPGMVDNCDEFYMVVSGDTCDSITSRKGISKDQLTTWNTGIGSDCKGLWLNTYACISIVGHTPTPTDPGNGIQTPLPIQSGMVDNCNKFHFVATNQNCDNIAAIYGISVSDFYRWNPAVGSSCSSLWSSTYACVGVKA
jgi:LysM repeat protein